MSHERNIKLLNDKRIVYKRDPINDVPTHETKQYQHTATCENLGVEIIHRVARKVAKSLIYI